MKKSTVLGIVVKLFLFQSREVMVRGNSASIQSADFEPVRRIPMKAFTEHPESVGESYFEHLRMSFGFGSRMLVASFGCFVHGIFPFICVKTGSKTIGTLHDRMIEHRVKHPCPEAKTTETKSFKPPAKPSISTKLSTTQSD